MFGDLIQLPPVRGSAVFLQPKSSELLTIFWQTLSFCELVHNMRQQGDTTFVNVLNDLRIGELKSEHIAIVITYPKKRKKGEFLIYHY